MSCPPVVSSRTANLDTRTVLGGSDEQYAVAELDKTALPMYSDMLNLASQPQMLMDLPESRYHGHLDLGLKIISSDQALLHREMASLGARRPQRGRSPIGLCTPGVVSLFEGVEITDEFSTS